MLPILLSLDPYDTNYVAKYTSPEGISFLSYSKEWDHVKLQELYQVLLKNKHGEELQLLEEVQVRSGSLKNSPATNGQYHPLTHSITLFHGDINVEPSDYTETLSHEYGHLVSYHYLKSFHFPFSKWAALRGLDNEPIRWDAFWNYSTKDHDWYPEEIMADDYVLLYGPTRKVDLKDVYSNEAFYLRTEHRNQKLQNVLGNTELHKYLEEKTGLEIDKNRLISTPTLTHAQNNLLKFSVEKRADIAYRLNVTVYQNGIVENYYEIIKISSNDNGELSYSLEDIFKDYPDKLNGHMKVNMDVLDLKTSLGFQTNYYNFKIRDNKIRVFLHIPPKRFIMKNPPWDV